MSQAPVLAALTGPFPLVRLADVEAVRQALTRVPKVLVLVGSANLARSARNPFTWEERARMLSEALPQELHGPVRLEPLREWYDQARTRCEIDQRVRAAAQGGAFEEITVPDAPDANALRDLLWTRDSAQAALAEIAPHVPPSVLDFLSRWAQGPEYQRLREEWQQIAYEKKVWSAVPWPVILVTVDALVRASDHVLLIRRGRHPGKGLYALPGGFLETSEKIDDAAVRELIEETRFDLPLDEVKAAMRGVHVLDHPRRSLRGRVVTHAYYFDLGQRPLPKVEGADDAAAAEWVPIARLPQMERAFLDDHFLILDHFLGLAAPPGRSPS